MATSTVEELSQLLSYLHIESVQISLSFTSVFLGRMSLLSLAFRPVNSFQLVAISQDKYYNTFISQTCSIKGYQYIR